MLPLFNYLKNPNLLFDSLLRHYGGWLPDAPYIKLRYRFQVGKRLELQHPHSFQEKLQWLKLYDHNPEYTRLVDKILVKDYVASLIGKDYVVPLLGVWDTRTVYDPVQHILSLFYKTPFDLEWRKRWNEAVR